MNSFSDALRDLARPHLAPALEQHELFHDVVDTTTRIWTDLATGLARIGDRELSAGMLGTFAEDATFQWAWAKDELAGTPSAELSLRLKDLGVRHGVPELAEAMIDLGRLPDPRLAANHLGLIAIGLLEARGLFAYGHGGRALTLMITADEGLPAAGPDPSRAADLMSASTRLYADPGSQEAVVTGYATHHDLPVRPVPGGWEIDFPQGDRLVALVDAEGRLGSATVTGPDGGPPTVLQRPAPRSSAATVTPPFPVRLLSRLVPELANVLHQTVALNDHLDRLGWDKTPPVWRPADELLSFGDRFDATAHEIARIRDDGGWEWAGTEWTGIARLRRLARECGAEDLAAGHVDLAATPRWGNAAVVLARAAVHLGEARGLVRVPDGDGSRYFAVTDPRVPDPGDALDEVCDVILSTADLIQPLVPPAGRYATMRSMVLGYFERRGLTPLTAGEPEMLMGWQGLYEVRVLFSHDGTVSTAIWGLQGTLA